MDPIKDIIKSHFFTDIIIYNYSRQITSILEDKVIMNIDELIKYLLKPIKNTSIEFYIENKHQMIEYFKKNIHKFSICNAIEESYLTTTLKRAFNPIENLKYNENFDVSISTPLSQLTISPSSVNNFLSNVQIILQKIQKRNLQNAQ